MKTSATRKGGACFFLPLDKKKPSWYDGRPICRAENGKRKDDPNRCRRLQRAAIFSEVLLMERRHFKKLTRTDRLRLEALLRAKVPVRQIAKILGRHVSGIYYEIKKGQYTHLNSDYTTEVRYSADLAQKKTEATYSALGAPLKIGKDHKFAKFIETMIIKEKYSPAAALNEARKQKEPFATNICVATLYSYIDKGVFLGISNKDLPIKGRKKSRNYRRVRRNKRPPAGKSIEERPEEVKSRSTFGHWEMDSVVGRKGGSKKAMLALSERKTRREIVILVPDHTAASVVQAMDKLERKYGEMFKQIFKTITVDNGTEFSDAEGMERSCLGPGKRTSVYYCHPYTSSERGTNENINRMIRRIYPKGSSFGKVTKTDMEKLNDWINTYPRKLFNYRTADDEYETEISSV